MGVTTRWGATSSSHSIQMENEKLRCFYIIQNDIVLMSEASKQHRFDIVNFFLQIIIIEPSGLDGTDRFIRSDCWFNRFDFDSTCFQAN